MVGHSRAQAAFFRRGEWFVKADDVREVRALDYALGEISKLVAQPQYRGQPLTFGRTSKVWTPLNAKATEFWRLALGFVTGVQPYWVNLTLAPAFMDRKYQEFGGHCVEKPATDVKNDGEFRRGLATKGTLWLEAALSATKRPAAESTLNAHDWSRRNLLERNGVDMSSLTQSDTPIVRTYTFG